MSYITKRHEARKVAPSTLYVDYDYDDHDNYSGPRISRGLEPRGRRLDGMLAPTTNKMVPILFFLTLTGLMYWIVTSQEESPLSNEVLKSPKMLQQQAKRAEVVRGKVLREMSVDRPAHPEASWAFRESYGILNDILDVSWESMREHARTFDQYFPEKLGGPTVRRDVPSEWYIFNLQPILNCPHVTRVGGHGDGPKWICNPLMLKHQKDCLIYSVGSAGVYTWEDTMVEMLDKNCEIHVFDPDPKYERPGDVARNNIHFHPWGLKSSYASDGTGVAYAIGETHFHKTFQEIVKALGHQNRRIDIFKIDCEGCEWNSYKDWIGHDIRQISIEVHGTPYPKNDWYKGIMDPTELYDAFPANGFAMYTKEPNAYSGGKAVEFSFLKMHPDFWVNAPIFDVPYFGNRIFGPHPELAKPIVEKLAPVFNKHALQAWVDLEEDRKEEWLNNLREREEESSE